jgi:hypothetical protein
MYQSCSSQGGLSRRCKESGSIAGWIMSPSKPRAAKTVDLALAVPRVAETLRSERVLKTASLAKAGIPKAQQAEAIASLLQQGFERSGKAGVRVALREQLRSLLAARGSVPLKGLSRATAGASQKEAKLAAEALVRDGAALFVIRGSAEALVSTSIPVLSRSELQALLNACKQLQKQTGAALRGATPKTLLREDVRALLLDLVSQRSTPERPPSLANAVLDQLKHAVRASVGLAFVPDAVRALSASYDLKSVQDALLDAARSGRIELQPESGVGRLNADELALCPPGPEGTRLSWARLLVEAP